MYQIIDFFFFFQHQIMQEILWMMEVFIISMGD